MRNTVRSNASQDVLDVARRSRLTLMRPMQHREFRGPLLADPVATLHSGRHAYAMPSRRSRHPSLPSEMLPVCDHTAALDLNRIFGACAVLSLRVHRMKGRARGTSAVDWRQGAVETTLAIRLSRGVMGSTGSGLQSCLLHRRGNDGDAASISDRVSTISGLSFPSERSNTPL